MNPDAPVRVTGTVTGPALNAHYAWVGRLLHGNEIWCDVNGLSVTCHPRHRQ